ncbi:LysE family translocator [Reyranella sp. CPCC 100927]|uniref:LysE family translocator n=1 Tax=Reyranella sp. CPCC 100927 TaxID=2599616 RepID=UPI0011B4354C|nr:LysE family translocator [Reyranella sp. CPCC 100927]TWT01240.1 LysE family translocator [Reyranella sp. CPCC 100927]
MDISLLFAAAIAGFVYGISPGPGVLAVLGIGAGQGRRAGAAFLVGHLAGDVLWATTALVAIIGVTAIGPLVFDILGAVSGVYLFWLGWRAVRARRAADGGTTTTVRNPLLHGAIFGLTNPKAYPVAVATFTALLSAKAHLLTWSMLPALVVASCVGGLVAYMILVAVVGAEPVRRSYRRHEILITRTSGLLFMGFAVHALLHAAPGLLPRRLT